MGQERGRGRERGKGSPEVKVAMVGQEGMEAKGAKEGRGGAKVVEACGFHECQRR